MIVDRNEDGSYVVSDSNSCEEERTHGTVEELSEDCQLVGFIRMAKNQKHIPVNKVLAFEHMIVYFSLMVLIYYRTSEQFYQVIISFHSRTNPNVTALTKTNTKNVEQKRSRYCKVFDLLLICSKLQISTNDETVNEAFAKIEVR